MNTIETKLVITPPEIEGKRVFKEGSSISTKAEFPDTSTVLTRLKWDDINLETKMKYDEKMRADYKFTKYYINGDESKVIVERVFRIEAIKGQPTWFGVMGSGQGVMYVYPRLKSAFWQLKESNDDIGIFYRYDSDKIVAYSINDSERVDSCISYIFNNQDKVREYMTILKTFQEKQKDVPFLHLSNFYLGTQAQNTGLAILPA